MIDGKRAERLDTEKLPTYFAEWTWSTDDPDERVFVVHYKLWRATAWEGETREPLFQDPEAAYRDGFKPMADCKPLVDGFRKWDGCTQWSWPADMHEDGVEDLDLFYRMLRTTLRVAAEIMGRQWDGGTP